MEGFCIALFFKNTEFIRTPISSKYYLHKLQALQHSYKQKIYKDLKLLQDHCYNFVL